MDELSNAMTLPKEQLARMESGEERFTAKLICQLAAHLKIEIRWFFSDLGGAESPHLTRDSSHPRDISLLVANARSRGMLATILDAKNQSRCDRTDVKAA